MILLPKWVLFNIYEMSSWSRAMLMPLAIINHFKPTRELPARQAAARAVSRSAPSTRISRCRAIRAFSPGAISSCACDRAAQDSRTAAVAADAPARAAKKPKRWMLERMGEGSDGLAAVFPAMLNALIALARAGLSEGPSALRRRRRSDFADCSSMIRRISASSRASRRSGTRRSTSSRWRSPACPRSIRRCSSAADWLMDKEVRIRGDWACKNPHPEAERLGLRVQQRLLSGHRRHRDGADGAAPRRSRTNASALDELFQRALAWLLSFQCSDGGWAAFDKDVTQALARRRAVRRSQRDSRSDLQRSHRRACSNCSATSVSTANSRSVQRALAVSARHAGGRRLVVRPLGRELHLRHLAGAARPARHRRGHDARTGSCAARDWLESCQNDDGGWGETCATYENPVLKGKGESTASQTAWALMGICACGDLDRPSMQRGLRYPAHDAAEPMAPGTSRRSPARVSRAYSI